MLPSGRGRAFQLIPTCAVLQIAQHLTTLQLAVTCASRLRQLFSMLLVAKGCLTGRHFSCAGGMIPLAVTLATAPVFDAFQSDSKLQALLHGHSYSAHATGCAAAVAAMRIYNDPEQNPNLCHPSHADRSLSSAPHPLSSDHCLQADDAFMSCRLLHRGVWVFIPLPYTVSRHFWRGVIHMGSLMQLQSLVSFAGQYPRHFGIL